ncbi:2-amino-4-hydroxy-6-hydroxymethyldihydropteridine diphosphokinase [Thalassotalea profundi]|uniref:2-amino-4-hydroxy-6-hydroxymethyldihydropteridine pyrophosphokinase n=1 Tax=Thalassotalea profundi TaxID=2036687 RepID=A0ABQ3J4X6_9GAMM|nr:2-amino-4-hydroxy-6-hydroxymethyldihydropteridine diphosphokinase [Thalassotalea profundi]GHF00545.1 2-amino-4-hydroxy-6-hydroxymethyldihydropteridine diphosphokinase [Thalassotalea profundi]
MTLVYIGLGSNLSNPKQQIINALEQLEHIENTQLVTVSSLYYSRPMGPQDQPDYMNAVAALNTSLSPLKLLNNLQAIENNAGRVRKDNRWGARILDLDILLFGQEVINTDRLIIPHYGLHLREFVVIPLAEIAPELQLPDGQSISLLARNIDINGLKVHSKLRD